MRLFRSFQALICGWISAAVLAWSQAPPPPNLNSAPAPTLVLAGGTLVDVTNWGRSARDQPDSIVVISEGKIVAAGSRADVPIPKGVRVIDCTGKYLIPGLVDGFAGMNSQGQANAFLYMGVTTVVASADPRRGHIDRSAIPGPHLYLLDSIGSTDDWSLLIGQPEWAPRLREGAHPIECRPAPVGRPSVPLRLQRNVTQ